MEDIKVLNVTATPVSAEQCTGSFADTLSETAKAMQQAMGNLGTETKEQQAEGYLKRFMNYVKSNQFTNDINSTAKKYNMPPQKLATNFFERALGTVGDILGIVINVACSGLEIIINTVSTIAHGIVSLIHSIGSALGRIVTLNKTCIA